MHQEPVNQRILVVDDNSAIHEDFRKVLGGFGHVPESGLDDVMRDIFGDEAPPMVEQPSFELSFATQGREALDLVTQARWEGRPFAVAFVDMRMPPGWDGLTTLEHLHDVDPQLQTVVCSAFSDYTWRDITARLGRLDRLLILKKPFEPIEALQVADALVTKWNLKRATVMQIQELDRSSGRLQGIVEHITAAISLKDTDGRYLLVNDAFCDTHELVSDAVLGKTDADLFAVAVARALAASEAPAWGRSDPMEGEEVDPRLPGRQQLCVRYVLREFDGDPYALCTVTHDITELRQMQDRMRQKQKMEAMGRLAGGVAHDFNNLLTTILGYGELAMDPEIPEATRKHSLELIVRAGQQAAELTEQLVSFSRKPTSKPRPIDINDVVRNTVSILGPMLGDAVRLEARLAERLPVVVFDPTQLGQVVLNLAVNAGDAMPDGGVLTIETRFEATAELAVTLEVSDTGCGIDPAIIEQIWEPFFTTKGDDGTGFGLATVHGIVRGGGGEINVRSEIGQGTTFAVMLPVSKAELASEIEAPGTEAPVTESAGELGQGETVLVVDDDPSVGDLAASILKRNGYRVLVARSGSEALAMVAEHGQKIAAVLSDYDLPGMSGIELRDRCLETLPDIRTVFMTGLCVDSMKELDVIQKPFDTSDLLARIRRAVSARQGVAR